VKPSFISAVLWLIFPFLSVAREPSKIIAMENLWNRAELNNDAPAVRLLLADEFVSQLDVLTSRDILTIVRGIAADGVAVVMTTHEMELADRYADTVIVLRDGEKVLDRRAQAETITDIALALRG